MLSGVRRGRERERERGRGGGRRGENDPTLNPAPGNEFIGDIDIRFRELLAVPSSQFASVESVEIWN